MNEKEAEDDEDGREGGVSNGPLTRTASTWGGWLSSSGRCLPCIRWIVRLM